MHYFHKSFIYYSQPLPIPGKFQNQKGVTKKPIVLTCKHDLYEALLLHSY